MFLLRFDDGKREFSLVNFALTFGNRVLDIATFTYTIALENLPPDQRCMGASTSALSNGVLNPALSNCDGPNSGESNSGESNSTADNKSRVKNASKIPSATVPLDRFLSDSDNSLLLWLANANETIPAHFFPIVLCGPSGVGKTSLAETIAGRLTREAAKHSPCNPATLMISASEFRRKFVNAVNLDSVEDFRRTFSQLKILVIDEIDLLKSSPKTQLELTRLVDVFSQNNKYMILTSKMLLSGEKDFQAQLASRLASGLVIPVDRPGIEARVEIVLLLSQKLGIKIDIDNIRLFAAKMNVSIPRLYSSLLDLEAYSGQKTISLDDVTSFLDRTNDCQVISIADISKLVAREFEISLKDMCGKTRRHSVVAARAVAMCLSRDVLGLSYQKIGKYFGNRDHSTVRHSIQIVESKKEQDESYSAWFELQRNKLSLING